MLKILWQNWLKGVTVLKDEMWHGTFEELARVLNVPRRRISTMCSKSMLPLFDGVMEKKDGKSHVVLSIYTYQLIQLKEKIKWKFWYRWL